MPDPKAALEFFRSYAESLRLGTAQNSAELETMLLKATHEFQDSLEELRVAEEELRQQNEELTAARQIAETAQQRYHELFESAPDAYFVTDAWGRIREANRAATALLGVDQEHLTGKPITVFIAAEHVRSLRMWLDRLAHDAAGDEREVHFQPRGSGPFPAAVRATARRGAGGQVVGLLWTVRDISKRKAAEEALRHERDFAEGLIETAQAVVLVLDPQGLVVRFNPYLMELTGYDLDEVRGQEWVGVFVPEPDRDRVREQFLPTTKEVQRGIFCPIRTRDGHRRELLWSNKILSDGAGPAAAVLAIGHDITELKEAQERAVQAERLAAIGQMVSGLSHEGRNCLQRSQACLEMLSLELRDRPAALNLIERVHRAQHDLHHLYEQVHEYAAPVKPKPEVRHLGQALRDAWAQLEPARRRRQAVLHEGPAPADLDCEVDPVLIRRVFVTILQNSLAAASDPVEIGVHWAEIQLEGEPAIQVSLRDNGPGLDAEQRARLFEPFFTTKTHGVGLGMAIAKRMVEAHGGRIAVGPSQSAGAEILITLPRRRP
jgi:PAS domain S-box-containing protein